MKTSAQWWAETKADPEKLNDWLLRQYRGECSAAVRLKRLLEHFSNTEGTNIPAADYIALGKIMKEEAKHAMWIRKLLEYRGFDNPSSDINNAENRYWSTQDLTFKNFHKTMAIGAHAEKMRLERIEVIVQDRDAPADIRAIFQMILTDERDHEKSFRSMAGLEAMLNTVPDHEEGRRVLGLEA